MAAAVIIPTSNSSIQSFRCTLDGVDYKLRFKFNTRDSRWYMDIYAKDDSAIVLGTKIVCLYPLLNSGLSNRLPPGFFYAGSGTIDNSPPGVNDLGIGRRCQLYYYPVNTATIGS